MEEVISTVDSSLKARGTGRERILGSMAVDTKDIGTTARSTDWEYLYSPMDHHTMARGEMT
jgi:hypothetical protein